MPTISILRFLIAIVKFDNNLAENLKIIGDPSSCFHFFHHATASTTTDSPETFADLLGETLRSNVVTSSPEFVIKQENLVCTEASWDAAAPL